MRESRKWAHHLQRLVCRVPCFLPPTEQRLAHANTGKHALSPPALHPLDLLKDVVRVLVLLRRAKREV